MPRAAPARRCEGQPWQPPRRSLPSCATGSGHSTMPDASTPMPDGLLQLRPKRRRLMRLIHVLGLIALLLSVPISAVAQSTPAAPLSAASGDFSRLVAIGEGRQLYLECRG